MKRICVFCGSNSGVNPVFSGAAEKVGRFLAENEIELVYGGGRVGLMGKVADAVLAAGGKVIGIIPESLAAKEIAHRGLSELHIVGSMHERKQMFADLSDGFIALPGGFGTFEEFCEIITWAQLGFHAKPCALLNVAGYYDSLIALFNLATEQKFVREDHRELVLTADKIEVLFEKMKNYRVTMKDKWLDEKRDL